MPDVFSREKRSEIMRKVKSQDTSPEVTVRKALHRLGYRFSLHAKDLPGKPDIVLPRHNTIIQVRGCFWHGHHCKNAELPRSNADYWKEKIGKNRIRDKKNDRLLRQNGWRVIVVWECRLSSQLKIDLEVGRIVALLEKTATE
jgi:DNA mismatch endonuclease (patch repair protein)